MTRSLEALDYSHYAGIFSQAEIAVCFVDSDLRYAWVNDAFARLLRYEPAELIGRPLLEITHPDDVDLDRELSERVFRGEIPYFTVRKRYIGGDGSMIVSDLLASVVFGTDGTPIMGIGVQTDAQHVDPTTQRIERLQRSAAIGQVTASAVHEIRSGLSAMSLMAQTLGVTAPSNEVVPMLREELDRLHCLLGSIAAFARPPSPGLPESDAPMLSVGALVDQTRALLELVIPAGTDLTFDLGDSSLFPMIEPREFQQVITNLVLNARDATAGGGTIAITAERTPGDPDCADIAVIDDGCGMDPDEVAKVFEPYFTTKGDAGTGLGMTICRDIVERHGGAVLVDSVAGKGSRVIVRLPLAPLRMPKGTSL